MGGFRRQRTEFIGVRLRPDEKRQLIKEADEIGCTPAELLRAKGLDRPPETRRCSKGHKGCTAEHRDLVNNYRVERHRQEVDNEVYLSNPTEHAIWKENGNSIVTFSDWLRAHTRQEEPDI